MTTERQPKTDRSTLAMYLQEIGQQALLTAQEEQELAKRARKGDEKARQVLIEANLRLVVYVAKRYVSAGDSHALLDLIQEGNLGLFRAVERFNPEHKTRFSTYAVYWIKQAIQRALSRQRTVRLPEHIVEDVKKMRRVRHRLYQDLGREPTSGELAAEMGLKEKKVLRLEEVSQIIVSLDQPVRGDEEEDTLLGDVLRDLEAPQPEYMVNQHLLRNQVRKVLQTLPDRHQTILKMRFGLDDGVPMTLAEVGEEFSISRERVRQIQEEAFEKIRARKEAKHLR